MVKDVEIFDHTADVGIRLARPTIEALFRDAAFAMFEIIAPGNEFQPMLERRVAVQGDDEEQLLVNWLSELNFLFQTELFVPADMEIKIDKDYLQADLRGEIADHKKHNIEIEIKAVTYHKIHVVKKGNLWRAQVIFDI